MSSMIMEKIFFLIVFVFYLLLIVAALMDFKFRRIDNHISFLLILSSIIISLMNSKSFLIISLLLVSLFIFLILGIIGGGDFKVFMSLILVDYNTALISIVVSLFIASISKQNKVPIAGISITIYCSLNFILWILSL